MMFMIRQSRGELIQRDEVPGILGNKRAVFHRHSLEVASNMMNGKPFSLRRRKSKPASRLLEVVPESCEIVRSELDARFELDICRTLAVGEETPASCFKQLVDPNACGSLFQTGVLAAAPEKLHRKTVAGTELAAAKAWAIHHSIHSFMRSSGR